MGTACWGTNESFDCHWISFGYGSRQDTTILWLSLEAYLSLSRLDDLPMGNYFGDISQEDYEKASPFRAYKFASETIHDADLEKQLEWFEQARKSRRYYEKNPEKVQEKAKDEAIRKRVYEMYFRTNGYTVAYEKPWDYGCEDGTDGVGITLEDLRYAFSDEAQEKEVQRIQKIAEEDKLILPGYDGKVENYHFIEKLHKTPEYQKRDIYTMGGIYHTRGWKDQCCQGPINWLGGEPPAPEKYADSNPNRWYRIWEQDRPSHCWKEKLAADEWDRINNWKQQ